MPSTAPLAKVTATKSYGANVVLEGLVYDDAYAKAVRFAILLQAPQTLKEPVFCRFSHL